MIVDLSRVIGGDPNLVWRAWRPAYPLRPRSEESRNLDLYPLAFGVKVPITLVALNEMSDWSVEHSLPGGRLAIDHRMSVLADGRIRLTKTIDVRGPMALVYRIFLVPGMRRAWPEEVKALEASSGLRGRTAP